MRKAFKLLSNFLRKSLVKLNETSYRKKSIKWKINLARKERRRRTRKAPKYYLKKDTKNYTQTQKEE